MHAAPAVPRPAPPLTHRRGAAEDRQPPHGVDREEEEQPITITGGNYRWNFYPAMFIKKKWTGRC